MDNLKRLQKLSLGLIIALVWFALLCFVVVFIGNVFKWSFLSSMFSAAFFSAFGIGLGALLALAILHATLTLNSISASLGTIAAGREAGGSARSDDMSKRQFMISMGASLGAIAVIVLCLFYGETVVDRHKIQLSLNSIESIARSPLAAKLVDAIERDATVKEVVEIRDALSRNIGETGGLSLLVAAKKVDSAVYYEVTPWWHHSEDIKDKPVSQASLCLFVPLAEERNKFNNLIMNKKPFSSKTSYSLRTFYPVVTGGKIECILMFDTSRQTSDAYLSRRVSSKE
ncbi:MAG: hypothetical protein WCG78_00065 [Candidatus Omnitrophota bacterium]